MNSEIKLTYKDPENVVHELRILSKSPIPGFYDFFSVTGCRTMRLNCTAVTLTTPDGNSTHGVPAFLDVLLARVNRMPQPAAGSEMWTPWRNSGPTLGRSIEVRHRDGSTKLEAVHSRIQIDALMQQGFSEWRYV